ncbi:MAG: RHS repeat-associated core domain-containing protein [Verrucomicrobiaceae bacterium]|nr:MAG: RHS repeat-associated core domain-containing protein [Verrucomicrobiaceae bacterium]
MKRLRMRPSPARTRLVEKMSPEKRGGIFRVTEWVQASSGFTAVILDRRREMICRESPATSSRNRIPLPVSFDALGQPVAADLECDFGFTGHLYHAESDLHLTLFRVYDQNIGRWLSTDPIAEKGGVNLYGYVLGNPVNWIDPLGLLTWGKRVDPYMQKILATTTGKSLVAALKECDKKNEYKILYDKRDDPTHSGFYKTITVGKIVLYRGVDGAIRDSTVDQNLVHEMLHALEALNKTAVESNGNKSCEPGYPNKAEENAVKMENSYLMETGGILRKDYYLYR